MPQIQTNNKPCPCAERIRVTGTVQGVGFRPFVWQLATALKLKGRVWNDAQGVVIEVWGESNSIDAFRDRLRKDSPPLARVEEISTSVLPEVNLPADFQIVESQQGEVLTNISPDAATCPQCLAEINDPANRRYRYPFTNCTHCGPRLSIINAVPYDRGNTSMAGFKMCPQCQAEYDEPDDRRFHAQPNACPQCGPSVWLEDQRADRIGGDFVDDIAHTAYLIQQGHIVAIKGIGGFHLSCDATNSDAVKTLRQRKHRYQKPFAMMARDIGVIHQYADVCEEEEQILHDKAAPIVILSMKAGQELAEDIAPGQTRLGFMLPYTPLHSLLLQGLDVPIVMTSGNRSEEVQCTSNEQARAQLGEIADYFLLHDRDIVNRLDDSVARIINGSPQLLRRARGYTPQPLKLPKGFQQSPEVLAMGAELKNSFCQIKNGKALVSQHQGDMEDASVFYAYRDNIDLYQQLFNHQTSLIAVDQHPDYISTKMGNQIALEQNIAIVKVQHHHAHIAACMAEHDLPLNSEPVLGISFDGLGLGDNGAFWGGEFLLTDYCHYQRLATFQPVAMPGGSKAMLEPWRNTFAHLQHSLGWHQVVAQCPNTSFVRFMQEKPVENLLTMMTKGLNSPRASSAGRLFDAVAALLGVCREAVSYEGQAAIQLEALAEQTFAETQAYPGEFVTASAQMPLTIEWRSLWLALLEDLVNGVPENIIAGRFHHTLASVVVDVVKRLSRTHHFNTIALAGGVMQNRLLIENLISVLSTAGFNVLLARQVPPNDGGLSLGQAVVAAAQALALKGHGSC